MSAPSFLPVTDNEFDNSVFVVDPTGHKQQMAYYNCAMPGPADALIAYLNSMPGLRKFVSQPVYPAGPISPPFKMTGGALDANGLVPGYTCYNQDGSIMETGPTGPLLDYYKLFNQQFADHLMQMWYTEPQQ